jgi:hypothetical protein
VKTTLFEAAAVPAPAALTPRGWNAPPTSTNEERDLERFRAYVTRLGPAALYDVRAHLDPDRFPRRFALVENELAHRRLLPAADRAPADPVWLRRLAGSALALLLTSGLLRTVGGCTIFVSGHEHLPFFTDLAAASPDVARLLFPLTLLGFVFCAAMLAGHGAASFFAAVRVRWKRTSAPARRNTGVLFALAVLALDLLLWRLLH